MAFSMQFVKCKMQNCIENAVSSVPSGWRGNDLNHKVLGQNLSLPDERSNRETSRRNGFYSVYLVSLQGLPFTLLYFIYIDLHRLLFIHYLKKMG